MELWGRKKKALRQADDAAVAAGCVAEWLRTAEEAEAARRFTESGRLDPEAGRRFAAWYRERVRLAMLEVTTGAEVLAERADVRADVLAKTEEFQAVARWLKAEGYE